MQLVFNELSIPGKGNRLAADEQMRRFLKVYTDLLNKYPSLSRDMLSFVDLNQIELIPDYLVSQWRNDQATDIEYKRRFRNLCERLQFASPAGDEVLCETADGKYGEGLQLAAEQGYPAFSFAFEAPWDAGRIACTISEFTTGETRAAYIQNFSTEDTLAENEAWMNERVSSEICSIKTGEMLLERLDALYSSLFFLQVARDQIKQQLTRTAVPVVAEKLALLNRYFSTWDGTKFSTDRFPPRSVSPQTKETLKRFESEHTFQYDGREIVVSYHMRYTFSGSNDPGRIYFHPDTDSKRGVICSVTGKLPTVSAPKLRI